MKRPNRIYYNKKNLECVICNTLYKMIKKNELSLIFFLILKQYITTNQKTTVNLMKN